MIQNVYLTDEIVSILNCYGPLDEVVHNILEAGASGIFDVMDKPKIPDKTGGRYYKIDIREPNYLELLETFGPKSSKISIRRLLYWFVENEIYVELGWETKENYQSATNDKSYSALSNLRDALYRAKPYLMQYSEQVEEFKNLINQIEDELWYAK